MSTARSKTGVILMTYGSATSARNVAAYFGHIYGGKASPQLIADFENRYAVVGGSPLVEITRMQAELLEQSLGDDFVVRAGMRHSEPFIKSVVEEAKSVGATRLAGIILAPQFSSFIMDGYKTEFYTAGQNAGFAQTDITLVGPWPDEPHFIGLLCERVVAKLALLEAQYGMQIPVIFTTHSLPKRVVEKDHHYLEQLQKTTDAVLAQISNQRPSTLTQPLRHYSAYQSAGHTPEEWLEPDLTDILKILKTEGVPAILIVPIQFLCDHLEILYDLDVAARAQCVALDIDYHRIALPNTDSRFIMSLHSLVNKYT